MVRRYPVARRAHGRRSARGILLALSGDDRGAGANRSAVPARVVARAGSAVAGAGRGRQRSVARCLDRSAPHRRCRYAPGCGVNLRAPRVSRAGSSRGGRVGSSGSRCLSRWSGRRCRCCCEAQAACGRGCWREGARGLRARFGCEGSAERRGDRHSAAAHRAIAATGRDRGAVAASARAPDTQCVAGAGARRSRRRRGQHPGRPTRLGTDHGPVD